MNQIEYDIPVFVDEDVADLKSYSEQMAIAIKNQVDKFGNPLNFKGTVDTVSGLQLTNNQNGDIYAVKEENKNYIWNGTEWVEYSDNAPTTTEEIINEVVSQIKNGGHIYGVKRNIESSDPSWERIEDSVGLIANATYDGTEVQNDFDNIYPWRDIITYNYDVEGRRITAYYGEPTFKFNGTNGEVLTRIPEFWYKRERKEENGSTYEYVYIADYEVGGFIKSEQFSIGRYAISGNESKIHSKSGYEPFVDKTIIEFRNYTRTLGMEFSQLDWHYFIIQLLYLVEYANYNSQDMLGKGIVNKVDTSSPEISGGCDTLGMKSGCLNNDGKHSVIYRGIEDLYGNVWQYVDGINIKEHQAYICYNSTEYQSDVFNNTYHSIGYINATANDYIKKLGYDSSNPLISLPTNIGGASNTFISDLYWCENGNRIACVGGCYTSTDLGSGLWFWVLNSSSNTTSSFIGSRLIKTD